MKKLLAAAAVNVNKKKTNIKINVKKNDFLIIECKNFILLNSSKIPITIL